jgi:hypothetical protein
MVTLRVCPMEPSKNQCLSTTLPIWCMRYGFFVVFFKSYLGLWTKFVKRTWATGSLAIKKWQGKWHLGNRAWGEVNVTLPLLLTWLRMSGVTWRWIINCGLWTLIYRQPPPPPRGSFWCNKLSASHSCAWSVNIEGMKSRSQLKAKKLCSKKKIKNTKTKQKTDFFCWWVNSEKKTIFCDGERRILNIQFPFCIKLCQNAAALVSLNSRPIRFFFLIFYFRNVGRCVSDTNVDFFCTSSVNHLTLPVEFCHEWSGLTTLKDGCVFLGR